MSYEGYEQHICQNGHRFDTGCGDWMDESVEACPICQALSVWWNGVDDTNCDECGVIRDWDSLLLTAQQTEVCNLGHTHVTKHATYRVPNEEEAEALRVYRTQSDACPNCESAVCPGDCIYPATCSECGSMYCQDTCGDR